DVQAERNIGTGIVHVVALDALVHDAKAAANNGLAPAVEVVGKAEARTEGSPVVIHQAFGHAVLAGNPKGLVDNHWASFGPRLGFAYDLNGRGKTVGSPEVIHQAFGHAVLAGNPDAIQV